MSEIAHDIIMESIGSLTEDEAMGIYHAMASQFGWAGTFFTRADAETEWQNQQYDDETGMTPDTPLPEALWEAIQSQWEWYKGLSDVLTERGWELVSSAVQEAMADYEPCNTCGGTGKWQSTTEDSPTELVDLGDCPDC